MTVKTIYIITTKLVCCFLVIIIVIMTVTIIYFELIAESRTFIIVGLVYECVFRVIDSVY